MTGVRLTHAALACLACGARVGEAQVTEATSSRVLVVRVRDALSSAPLPNVGFFRDSSTRLGTSDSTGSARLRFTGREPARIVARAIGFSTREFMTTGREAGDSLTVLLLRSAAGQALPAVDVTAAPDARLSRYADYDRRRASGRTGIFITRTDIERQNPFNLLAIFRRYPSIKVIDSLGTEFVVSARTAKPMVKPSGAKASDMAPCVLRMMIDGVPLPVDFDLSQIHVSDVHAVEVYAGPASIPVEFAGMAKDSQCGVVMVWTRNR